MYKTPTLLNADFNAPYFHDGRYASYDQVVAYFDRFFDLGLSPQDRHDLVAYLSAVGDGERAFENDGVPTELKEANDFASVLATAIPAHDTDVIFLQSTRSASNCVSLPRIIPTAVTRAYRAAYGNAH